MAILGALNIPLSVTTGGLSKGLKRARKDLNSFVGAFSGVQGALAGVGLTLTTAGFVAFVNKQMEAIDVAAKLSDRLGMTTESLTALQHAGDLAGVSAEELEGSFNKLQKAIGDAQDESTPAANAFRAMGLSARELANLPLDKSFELVADRISKMQNPVDRAQIALALFGKAGQRLLPLLSGGAEGIKQAREEAEKLGISFNRIDAAKVEAANDAMTRTKAAVTGLGTQLAINLSPYVEAIANKFTEMATSGTNANKMVSQGVAFATDLIGKMANAVDMLAMAWLAVQANANAHIGLLSKIGAVSVDQLIPDFVEEALGIDAGRNFMNDFADGMLKEADAGFKAAAKIFNAPDSSANVANFFGDLNRNANKAAEGIANAGQKMGSFDNAFRQAEEQQKKLEELKSKAAQVFADTRTPEEKFDAQLKQLSELRDKGLIDPDTFARAMNQAESKMFSELGKGDRPAEGIKGSAMGSADAFSSIQASIREGAGDPQKNIASNTKIMASNSNSMKDSLLKLVSGSPEVIEDF